MRSSAPLRPIRCAIYTRKSTEEGLDQVFNSLDAQKEACAAYITSQRHEGWSVAPRDYDDGGFSGGTLERPALKRLLDEVRAGRVDVIVVYKIDRLTRSLGDFSRIVEVLDGAGASFVSVTQAFNTTTSMGRLTLNVLLSFAQFEREVTGERIRDKIAASKAKGMWMGGVVPLGYDVMNRKLVVNESEAEQVRHIFSRYLALASVLAVQSELEAQGFRSKLKVTRTGRQYGGAPLSRGALYLLLQNRIYVGDITHKGTAHRGEHQGIVDAELFAMVQAQLARNRIDRSHCTHAGELSLLTGLLWDGHGRRMSPRHAVKQVKRYRYYVSRAEGEHKALPIWRVPAGLEELILGRLRAFLEDSGAVHDAVIAAAPDAVALDTILFAARQLGQRMETDTGAERRQLLLRLVVRIALYADRVDIHIARSALQRLGASDDSPEPRPGEHEYPLLLSTAGRLARIGKEVRLVVGPSQQAGPGKRDPALIKLIAKAHSVRAAVEKHDEMSFPELATVHGHGRHYFGVLLRLAYLAPDIVSAILDGRQPLALTRQKLARLRSLPTNWAQQREALGFGLDINAGEGSLSASSS